MMASVDEKKADNASVLESVIEGMHSKVPRKGVDTKSLIGQWLKLQASHLGAKETPSLKRASASDLFTCHFALLTT